MNQDVPRASQPAATFDPAEVDRFAAMADEWWDRSGKFRPLHQIAPTRLQFIRDRLIEHFQLTRKGTQVLRGLSIVDVGCGGGLISEPLARLGANVTGVDPAHENIAVASRHAEDQGLEIDYRCAKIEQIADEGHQFDVVTCLEVIEHVPEPSAFLATCAGVLKPGGAMIVSTINRTVKSYALAIVAAENVLRWLPVGTHQWERFVTPDELQCAFSDAGLTDPHFEGVVFNPLRQSWHLATDTDVNYMAAAIKPA